MKTALQVTVLLVALACSSLAAESWGEVGKVVAVTDVAHSMPSCFSHLIPLGSSLRAAAKTKLASAGIKVDGTADAWIQFGIECRPIEVGKRQVGEALYIQMLLWRFHMQTATGEVIPMGVTWGASRFVILPRAMRGRDHDRRRHTHESVLG